MSIFKKSILRFMNASLSTAFIFIFNHNALAQLSTQSGLFQFVRTVQVTPDSTFSKAGFVRLGYVSATNSIVATFGTHFIHPTTTDSNGRGYKEYALDMQPTGKSGMLNTGGIGDCNGLIVDSVYYDVNVDPCGWRITTFNTLTWVKTRDIIFPLDTPREGNGDMMIAFVNGFLDISSGYTTHGGAPPPDSGAWTHHQFLSPNLKFLDKRILSDTPHIGGSSLIFVDSIYYFVSATAYTGDVIVMKYDRDWKYLGAKKLISQAHWSEGLAWDGLRFYVSYLNTSQRNGSGFFPYYPNVHLAAFDKDWNLIDDIAVTDYTPTDSMFTGRPSLLQLGNRLYVSYDAVPLPEDLTKIEGYVKVYELHPTSITSEENHTQPMEFRLEQNYPNPFNPTTVISYQLPIVSHVTLKVYDMLGREVSTLVDGAKEAGYYSASFNGSKFTSGVYLTRFVVSPKNENKPFVQVKKMLIIK